MDNKRNTSKEKKKRNKSFPYKRGGGSRTLGKIFKKAHERIEKEVKTNEKENNKESS